MDSTDEDVIVISSEDAEDTSSQAAAPDEEPRAAWPVRRDSAEPGADFAVGGSGVATPADETAEDVTAEDEAGAAEGEDPQAMAPGEAGQAGPGVPAAEVPGAVVTGAMVAEPEVPRAEVPRAEVPRADDGEAWPRIQALFVDDPRSAVRQAADVASGAVATLVAAARNREQALRGWEDGDTEELRSALREYRDLASRIDALAREI